ncbi:MAG: potassium-transporting ATPase subunit KdpC [Planctomycetes bacterium]|nr:potassium-transporting ATPase subunit KdpC [Planctomycetota bacterium]
MSSQLLIAMRLLGSLSLLCGVGYPALVLGAAELAFPERARGSLIESNGRCVGSELVGQPFDDPQWFASRPSATAAQPYDARASSGSNLGPTSPALASAVAERIAHWRGVAGSDAAVPVDLVTTSASGLDPHVTPAAAFVQVPRVAAARGLDRARVRDLVERCIEERTFGILGERRVNVLRLNLALDELR